MKSGVLLINLGTPEASNLSAVKRYLREFLTDRRVIDLPWIVRQILVRGIIVPFRAKQSTHAYQEIWTPQGSPLLHYSLQLAHQVQNELGEQYKITLGMRYGSPSVESALDTLSDCQKIIIIPLYPHYSSAASGSAIEEALNVLKAKEVIPTLSVLSQFYQEPDYIEAQSNFIKPMLANDHHLLFSYHGIPERHIKKSGCSMVCNSPCPSDANPNCYRAQCYESSKAIAERLNLSTEQFSTSFQSRLGKTPWIKPYTDELLVELAERGVRNLTVTCPSFVADCLETIEEIGMRAKEEWLKLGGQQFKLIPAMNNDLLWSRALSRIILSVDQKNTQKS